MTTPSVQFVLPAAAEHSTVGTEPTISASGPALQAKVEEDASVGGVRSSDNHAVNQEDLTTTRADSSCSTANHDAASDSGTAESVSSVDKDNVIAALRAKLQESEAARLSDREFSQTIIKRKEMYVERLGGQIETLAKQLADEKTRTRDFETQISEWVAHDKRSQAQVGMYQVQNLIRAHHDADTDWDSPRTRAQTRQPTTRASNPQSEAILSFLASAGLGSRSTQGGLFGSESFGGCGGHR